MVNLVADPMVILNSSASRLLFFGLCELDKNRMFFSWSFLTVALDNKKQAFFIC